MNVDIEQLEHVFEEEEVVSSLYGSLAEELDAVAGGTKAVATYSWTRVDLDGCPEDYVELREGALERRLTLMHLPARFGAFDLVRVYALRAEHAWRAQAHVALWEIYAGEGHWSMQAEALESFLLGYTEDQRREWLARCRWRRAAYGAVTGYLVIDSALLSSFDALGRRAVPTELAQVCLVFAGSKIVRREALERLPGGLTLGRVGVTHSYRRGLMEGEDDASQIVVRMLSRDQIPDLNRALSSNVEILTESGWW